MLGIVFPGAWVTEALYREGRRFQNGSFDSRDYTFDTADFACVFQRLCRPLSWHYAND